MAVYKITLKPLMPYFFGGETTFGFGRNDSERSSYYIKSEELPSQTTLFGMLRYQILKKKGLLFENGNTPDKESQTNAVGEKTFTFDSNEQSFGIIEKITPVLLSDGTHSIIPCPLSYVNIKADDEKTQNQFIKLKVLDKSIINSADIKSFPTVVSEGKERPLTDKEYPVGKFIYVEKNGTIQIVSPISREVRIGINSHRCENEATTNDESFFKKEYCRLNEKYSFMFYAFLKEDIIFENSIVYMGQGKSPFAFTSEKVEESEYEDITQSFVCLEGNENYDCYMALSDCWFNKDIDKSNILWSMISTHPAHNLIGKPSEKTFYSSYKRSDTQLLFINKGSVFFVEKNSKIQLSEKDEKMLTIGMNSFIKIGG